MHHLAAGRAETAVVAPAADRLLTLIVQAVLEPAGRAERVAMVAQVAKHKVPTPRQVQVEQVAAVLEHQDLQVLPMVVVVVGLVF
jgi:hypothetical protein